MIGLKTLDTRLIISHFCSTVLSKCSIIPKIHIRNAHQLETLRCKICASVRMQTCHDLFAIIHKKNISDAHYNGKKSHYYKIGDHVTETLHHVEEETFVTPECPPFGEVLLYRGRFSAGNKKSIYIGPVHFRGSMRFTGSF